LKDSSESGRHTALPQKNIQRRKMQKTETAQASITFFSPSFFSLSNTQDNYVSVF
jgi:hypothetical protein